MQPNHTGSVVNYVLVMCWRHVSRRVAQNQIPFLTDIIIIINGLLLILGVQNQADEKKKKKLKMTQLDNRKLAPSDFKTMFQRAHE